MLPIELLQKIEESVAKFREQLAPYLKMFPPILQRWTDAYRSEIMLLAQSAYDAGRQSVKENRK